MFSGQGSQYYHMGKELYENNTQFKYWMNRCNEIIEPLINTSIIDILYNSKGKSETFDRLLYTSPALFSVEYSLYKIVSEMGIKPDYLLGYSLGEIIASVVSEAITLQDGLHLIIELSKMVEEKTQPSAMLAIMESKMIVAEFSEMFENCSITGFNFNDNFVVTGSPNIIKQLQQDLNDEEIITQLLPVNYGFHTAFIDSIEKDFKKLVRPLNNKPTKIPIISSSLHTETIKEFDEDYFWNVIRYPVHFDKAVEKTLAKGEYIFIDLGPSGTLATFVKYILSPNSKSFSIATINQFGKDINTIEKLITNISLIKN